MPYATIPNRLCIDCDWARDTSIIQTPFVEQSPGKFEWKPDPATRFNFQVLTWSRSGCRQASRPSPNPPQPFMVSLQERNISFSSYPYVLEIVD